MGYVMEQLGDEFKIKKENFEGALAAIKGLSGKETIHDASGPHFSWVDTKEYQEAKTLPDALKAWRWEARLGIYGDVIGVDFAGEKAGDDDILFNAIAPFVERGSYIEMEGEDRMVWKWKFDGRRCKEI